MTLAFELVDSVGRLSSPVWVGIDQSFLGLKRIKVKEGGIFPTLLPFFPASLIELGYLISSSLTHGLGFTPLASMFLRPLDFD